jgi:hypothetical protein
MEFPFRSYKQHTQNKNHICDLLISFLYDMASAALGMNELSGWDQRLELQKSGEKIAIPVCFNNDRNWQ